MILAGRAWAGAALLAALVAAASPAHACGGHGLPAVAADETPARWRSEVALGADRSGDLRGEASAILEAVAAHVAPFTLADAEQRGLARPPRMLARATPAGADRTALATPELLAFALPQTIRVWRRGLDGSSASCSGRVDVIPFETYVKGVLPHEWIRSWRTESLEAGAVAIRTYAAWWVNAGGKYSCADLDDTTASQVYRDQFYPNTDAVVDATAGQVVVRDGSLVFAEYSAENSDPTAYGVVEPLCTGRAVYGHGRGTCQWGTQRWALEGRSHDWMMRHYYPGADVEGIAPIWAASLAGQQVRAELVAGEEMVVWLEYRNDGNQTWDPERVFVGTTEPRDRASVFYKEENWASPSRPTGADHSQQAPGAVARFTWAMVAPEVPRPTTFVESFGLVTADGTWFGPVDDAVTWEITVRPGDGDGAGADGGSLAGGCDAGGGSGPLLPLFVAVALVAVWRRGRDLRPALLAALAALGLAAVLGG
jgi:uncharacterized protein (TIGR03382 family)